jgi:hypothetical protein
MNAYPSMLCLQDEERNERATDHKHLPDYEDLLARGKNEACH